MPRSLDESFHGIIDGSDRSASAAMLRFAAGCAAPLYGTVMRSRNALYDTGILRGRSLGRPTVSIGNITLGGTGKTPVVAWLASQMNLAAKRPAVLLRGYKTDDQGISDEQSVLQSSTPNTLVIANPSRIHAAAQALRDHPDIALFILDDAMQHRRARRDFDLVLIHACNPFGHDRIFPRGLLREPVDGLRRASALLITHASEVSEAELRKIETRIRLHTAIPVFRSDHVITGLLSSAGQTVPPEDIQQKTFYAFCGIGSPDSFLANIRTAEIQLARLQRFADHHNYTPADLAQLRDSAAKAGATALLTTEKDWTKLAHLGPDDPSMPIVRAQLHLKFWPDHESHLLTGIQRTLFP